MSLHKLKYVYKSVITECPIQHFEADFLWNINLKILNSGIILKKFTDDSLHIKLSLALDSLDGWTVKMLTSFGILPGSES